VNTVRFNARAALNNGRQNLFDMLRCDFVSLRIFGDKGLGFLLQTVEHLLPCPLAIFLHFVG